MLYPLLTQPKMVEPIWGGTSLAAWLDLPEPRPSRLGEIWQVYDTNQVRNGPLAGRTLAELAQEYGAALVGTRTTERYGNDFPLLAKFIDAADRLSIQVHPDDSYAHTVEAATGFHGKTEAWYIVEAAPDADITYGVDQATSRQAFAEAIAAGHVEELVRRVPVRAGDTVFVPAGTLHAINAGIVLFEIQQKSDLTYRVYDYNRRDAKTGQLRELHLEKALDVLDYQPPAQAKVPGRMLACPYFALEYEELNAVALYATEPDSFEILTVIAGKVELSWHRDMPLVLPQGTSVVIPANLPNYHLSPLGTPQYSAEILRAYVPDLARLKERLRAEGHSDEYIAQVVFD